MSRTSEVAAPATIDLLIATDGTRDADGAVRVGRALALRDGAAAELVSVVEPFPLHAGAEGAPLPDVHQLTTLMAESRAAALLEQRDRTHPGIHDWPFEIDVGPRAEMIAANAERKGASLILMGLGEHGVTARLAQRETALQVMRTASVPVLALPRHAWGVPHSAVAAIDFTASSERAAAAALDLLGGEGTLFIAHVVPRTMIPHAEPSSWEDENTAGILKRLQAVVRRLDPPPGVRIEYALLHGDPAHELLAFAEEVEADLVAAGAHGRSALGRLLMGSVSTRLVRTAECWVLVAPADASATPV